MGYNDLLITSSDYKWEGAPRTINETIAQIQRANPRELAAARTPRVPYVVFVDTICEYAFRHNLIGEPSMIAARYAAEMGIEVRENPPAPIVSRDSEKAPSVEYCIAANGQVVMTPEYAAYRQSHPAPVIATESKTDRGNRHITSVLTVVEALFFVGVSTGLLGSILIKVIVGARGHLVTDLLNWVFTRF